MHNWRIFFPGQLEADEAPLNLIYNKFGEMYQRYAYKRNIQAMVKRRWDFLCTECTGIAYMLTPKFAAEGFNVDNDRLDILGYVRNFVEANHPEQGAKAEEEMGEFGSSMVALSGSRKETAFKMTCKAYWNCIDFFTAA